MLPRDYMGGPRTVLRFCARTVRASKAVTQFSFIEPKLFIYRAPLSHWWNNYPDPNAF